MPAAADHRRQRDHPGPRLQRGPVRLRGRAARAGRPGRGEQRHRVRRAADDPLRLRARRHPRARGDGAAHRRGVHRAQQDPAPGDVAGAAQRLLPDPGGRREPRRHRRLRLPQGPHQAGLRPARGRDHRAGRVGDAAGALRPRLQADRRAAARDAGRAQARRASSSTSTAAPPAWSPSRTCWRRSSARSPTSTTSPGSTSSTLADGRTRVSSRYPVDDLEDICGVAVEDDDVDSVGGLMAKHLGRVPIAGSVVEAARAAVRGRGPRRAAQPDRHRAGQQDRAGRPRAPPRSPTLSTMPADSSTDPEDLKLVTLARSTRARTRAARGRLRAGPGRPHLRRRDRRPADAAADRGRRSRWRWRSPAGRAASRPCVVLGDAAVVTRPTCPSYATCPAAAVPVHLAAPDGTVVASRRVLAPSRRFRTRGVPVHARRL